VAAEWGAPELVVVPTFNELVGGTWINEGDFLTPFLPAALPAGEVYLLDGTRLGDYRELENRRA
jgi:metallophosphoesterase superfamily enzyme